MLDQIVGPLDELTGLIPALANLSDSDRGPTRIH